MTWKCTTCDEFEIEIIPDDAVRLNHTRARTYVYRFSDGAIHSLPKIRNPMRVESFPPPLPEGPKEEETELLQSVVEVLTELPDQQPQPEPEIIEEVEEPSTTTTMAAAFRNFKS